MDLSSLARGKRATVTSVSSESASDAVARRLLELGFIPGTPVEALHRAPLSGDPLSFMVRGTHIALRRHEAQRVLVKPLDTPTEHTK